MLPTFLVIQYAHNSLIKIELAFSVLNYQHWHILKEISAMRFALNMVCARTMELKR